MYKGQKISWLTLFNGKIAKATGIITLVVGEWLQVKGKTELGAEITDRLTVYDNSIELI